MSNLNEIRQINQAISKAMPAAIAHMTKLMTDEKQSPALRLKAAEHIMSAAQAWHLGEQKEEKIQELEESVSQLEELLEGMEGESE